MTESGHYCHTPQIRVLKAVACMTRSLLMPGPDEAMDLKPLGGLGTCMGNLGICGYGDAFWGNLMAELYSAEMKEKSV